MVLSTSQQVALAFTAVLFTFVVLPRLFGGNGGAGAKDARFDPRYTRKGPGPGAVRGQAAHKNSPGSQSAENMQNMKKLMEQEMKSDKYKTNNNKGYVFTLMPLYAIGVGVFAAYKFLKIKSADDQTQKEKIVKGTKKSVEAENQLNELEQRLAQTERMLNSILTQLDPLTNCVKSVAQEQKNEIMNQLQTIRYLMKKRGMDCPPLNQDGSCERNLDDLIQSLGTKEKEKTGRPTSDKAPPEDSDLCEKRPETEGVALVEQEVVQEVTQAEEAGPEEEDEGDSKLMPSLEESCDTNIEEIGAESVSGLRRRNRPE